MEQADSLGVGLYSLVEAARLLTTPRRTLARWVEGYVQELRGGSKRYAPIIERADEASLTFGDLVELMYVRGFRGVPVPLNEIRDVSAKYRQEWNTPYPLATKRFATDGRNLLIQQRGDWEHALSGQRQAFFEEIGRQLVHVGDLTSEWRPLGRDKAVVLHPDRSFGKPIEDKSGAHTFLLFKAVEGGASVEEVAWWYDTEVKAVREAVEFERSLNEGTARAALAS
ncbi:MAG: hypothetical protein QY327_12055 [Fimbriimonadaceae bacterium]|nr:MAG: hypothetical protein UZ18_ATM001000632 [Armatimonadetes bacterium OLB18]WKZ80062.1 MAG: hypothetical protein QY327_12055 [Fimbriimonadaceae bacterium]